MNKLTSSIVLYKLVILRFAFFTANTLIMAMLGSLAHVDWAALSPFGKFVIILAGLGNWTTVMLAFFDRSIASVQGGPPIPPAVNDQIPKTTQ